MNSQTSLRTLIKNFFKRKSVQYALLIIFATLFALLLINPVQASAPYQTPPDNAQEFSWFNAAYYQSFTINATVPEGDALFENNSLGWQLLKVRYKADDWLSDAQSSLPDVTIPTGQHVQEFQDEFWWEGLAPDFLNSHMIPGSHNFFNNTYFLDSYAGEAYRYASLNDPTSLNFLNFMGQKYSGYRFKATVPSPEQSAVLYCNLHGYTYHNVTEASSQTFTGFGGLRPSYITEYRSVPVQTNYNLSLTNPVLTLTPINATEANMNVAGVKDFSNSLTIGFETLGSNDEWGSDASVTAIVVAIVGLVSIGCIIYQQITYGQQIEALQQLLLLSNAYTADTQYKAGADDQADAIRLQILQMQEELNLSQQQIDGLLDIISRTNTWVKGNFTNPYLFVPPTGFNPLQQATEVNIVVLAAVIGAIIVVIIIVAIVIAYKMKKGNKNKSSSGTNINILGSGAKTNVLSSISEIFFFGLSTGAI